MIWKHARGFENLYEVSSCGLVRTIPREVIRSNERVYKVKQNILKPSKDSYGYLRVGLSLNGKLVTKKIHRLVASTFIDGDHKKEVNHKDGNKTNNNVNNLEWVTRSENQKHAFKIGLQRGKSGSKNPSSKIDEEKAMTVKTLIQAKWSLASISRKMNISYHIVKDINRRKTWCHVEL